jgi:AcrR family transcriptional regulator
MDRRTTRTRKALEDAFNALLAEKHYDDITVNDITERANVGRSTFYIHYPSKLDLFLALYQQPHLDSMAGNTREVWLDEQPPHALVAFVTEVKLRGGHRALLPTFANSESANLLGILNRTQVKALEADLRQAFDDLTPRIPYPLLAQSIAGIHMWMIGWWTESRSAMSAYELAANIQRTQRAILREAFGLV